jgi:hypothetical protein
MVKAYPSFPSPGGVDGKAGRGGEMTKGKKETTPRLGRTPPKEGNVPKLRFPEFRDDPEWADAALEELITTVTPPAKLPSSNYRQIGTYPIVDQSQQAICGWTDDASAVVEEAWPLIIFGDHTCAIKLIRQPFAQGADGIKIFKAKAQLSTEYLFHSLNHRPLVMEDYKRHFSILKERRVFYPGFETGEQQKIADCLSSLDELIAAQGRKIGSLKAYKRGLMQQLFPCEGKTLPRLRFPEFRDAPEWVVKPLCKVAANLDNKRVPITESERLKGSVPYYGASGVVDYVEDYLFDEELLCVSEDGANLVARTYPIAFSISGKTWVNNHAHVLRFEESATQKIVEDYLNSIDLKDFITGMAQPKLNRAMLDTIPVPLPEADERKTIADFLRSLDVNLVGASGTLDALKSHKKGLMQQLFPALDKHPTPSGYSYEEGEVCGSFPSFGGMDGTT